MNYHIERGTRKDAKYADGRVLESYYAVAPEEENLKEEDIVLKIEDENGNIAAGCIVYTTTWGKADIDILWVDEKYRLRGLGTRLIREAERITAEKGYRVAVLGTFDFQAKGFYEKLGYTLCGTIENCPEGHANYTFAKRLDRTAPAKKDKRAANDPGWEIKTGDEDDAEFIDDKLGEYNDAHYSATGKDEKRDRKIVDENGEYIGGIVAQFDDWDVGFIERIWVEERYRGRGFGSRLLENYERAAKKRGVRLILVWNAYDWNEEFFKKNGYVNATTVDDLPKGHVNHLMEKRL